MALTNFSHRGHRIVVDDAEAAPNIFIDGEHVQVSRIAPGLFANNLMPHTNFTSLEALAKAAIDHSSQFYGRRDANS